MVYYGLEMGETHRCPKCNGTEMIWDRETGKVVSSKDRTPVNKYKIEE